MTIPRQDRNLILTGYTGPNQPAIVTKVAERLKMPYVILDTRIESRADIAISEVLTLFGETRLKHLEHEAIDEAVLRRGSVLQINGRTFQNDQHHLPRLQATGTVICLVAALDTILQRLHLTMGARYHNPEERAQALGMLKREWAVRKHEGVLELDTTIMTPEETVSSVVLLWESILAS